MFNDHWGSVYMITLTVCDVLVLVAVIMQVINFDS